MALSGQPYRIGAGVLARAAPPQQAQRTRAVSAPQRAEPPQYLPGTARAILQKRMASHARDMGDLVSAIMLLD